VTFCWFQSRPVIGGQHFRGWSGVNVMITNFCDFANFRPINVNIMCLNWSNLSEKTLFRRIFWRKYFNN
jgi:hypothetical protein